MKLEIKDLTFSYGEKRVLDGLGLTLSSDVTVVMGASGSGKTTLLRLIAGLERPSGGTVTGVPDRPAFMFQEDRLLPWLTAIENVAAVMSDPGAAIDYLRLVELSDEAASLPDNLSGGQRRRVSLARALAYRGGLLLLDEPLKGLDEALAARIVSRVRSVGTPVVVTCHSEFEASEWGGERVVISA